MAGKPVGTAAAGNPLLSTLVTALTEDTPVAPPPELVTPCWARSGRYAPLVSATVTQRVPDADDAEREFVDS